MPNPSLTLSPLQLRLSGLLALGLILLLTLVAYAQVLDNTWVTWDTRRYVLENPHIKSLSWENFYWMWGLRYGNWTPLAWLSHALTYAAFGLNAWGHHLINLILHLLNTLLIFVLTLQLWRIAQQHAGQLPPVNLQHLFAASLAALLFSVHPQHVESVAWIAERKGMLSAFFTLLTLLSYCQYTLTTQRAAALRWYFTTLALFALALMSKPVVTPLPLVLLCLDFYPLHRHRVLWVLLEKLPFLMLSLGVSVIAWLGQAAGGALADLHSLLDRLVLLISAASNTLFYVNKWLFPVLLSPFYPASEHYPNLYSWRTLVTLSGVLGLTFLALYAAWRGQRVWLVVWLSYLLMLAPVSGLVQFGLHSAADRFAYIPTMPFYILTGIGLVYLWGHLSMLRRLGLAVVMVLVFGALIHLTQQQTLVWRNDFRLWHYVVHLSPTSWFAHRNIGISYMEMGYHEQAISHFQYALHRQQDQLDILIYLAEAYYLEAEYAVALAHYQSFVATGREFDEGDYLVHLGLARTYKALGDVPAALESIERAQTLYPNHPGILAVHDEILAMSED